MEEVVVFGSGAQARLLILGLMSSGKKKIAGLIDDNRQVGFEVLGYKVLGGIDDLNSIGVGLGMIGIGDNWQRMQIAARIAKVCPDFRFATLINPLSKINDINVEIGAGTAINTFVVIDNATRIGKHCIVSGQSLVGHDCQIGDFVTIHPKVAVCGNVRVGVCTTLSVGTNVIQGVNIGEHTVIGAGSTVVHDIPAYSFAYGVPCRVVRQRQAGEAYL